MDLYGYSNGAKFSFFLLYVFSLILFISSHFICIQSHFIYIHSTFIYSVSYICFVSTYKYSAWSYLYPVKLYVFSLTLSGAPLEIFLGSGGFQKIKHNFESYQGLSIEMNFQKCMCQSKLFDQIFWHIGFVYKNI